MALSVSLENTLTAFGWNRRQGFYLLTLYSMGAQTHPAILLFEWWPLGKQRTDGELNINTHKNVVSLYALTVILLYSFFIKEFLFLLSLHKEVLKNTCKNFEKAL